MSGLKARLLFDAKDHPNLNSGYGIISRYLLPRLGERYGRDNVLIYAPVYQRDYVGEWDGMKVLPGRSWDYGENKMLEHYEHYDCNLLITVGDTWPLGELPDLAAQNKVLWTAWLAQDWLGMPANILNRIKPAYKLIPFSQHGEAALLKAGLTNVGGKIWPGLNTELWRPAERDPKVMATLGYGPETFNLMICAANQERKQVRPQLEAIAIFREQTKAPVRLYLHSVQKGDRDLSADCDELGLADIVVYPEPYLMEQGGFPEHVMVKCFNTADLVLNCAHEGFGYSQLQAQACGVPVIGLSEGSGPEITPFGIDTFPLGHETTPSQMAQARANPIAIAQALADMWQRRQKAGGPLRSEKAAQFVQDNFSWEQCARQWYSVIDCAMADRELYCMDIPEKGNWNRERMKREVEI